MENQTDILSGLLQELQQHDTHLRELIELAPAGVVVAGTDGTIHFCNAAFAHMLAYDESEVRGATLRSLTHQEDVVATLNLLRDIDQGRVTAGRLKKRFMRRDGQTVWCEIVARGIRDAAGKTAYVLGLVQDISSRRKEESTQIGREIALLQQKRLLEFVLSSIGEGVVVCDEAGEILIYNETAEKILGTGPKESAPSTWLEACGVFHPDGKTLYPSNELPLALAMQGKETRDVRLFIRHDELPEGAHICVTGTPLRDEKGNIKGGVVVFRQEKP